MFGEAGRLLAGALDGRRDQVVIARKIRTPSPDGRGSEDPDPAHR